MRHLTAGELRFKLVIDAKLIGLTLFMLGAAGEYRAVGGAGGINQVAILLFNGGVTGVLAQSQGIVELVLKFIANHRLFTPRLVVVGIADVKIARNIAAVDAFHGTVTRQEVTVAGIRIFLIAG